MKNERKASRRAWKNVSSFLGGVLALWLVSLFIPFNDIRDELIVDFLTLSRTQIQTLFYVVIIVIAVIAFVIGFFLARGIFAFLWKKEKEKVESVEEPIEEEVVLQEAPIKADLPKDDLVTSVSETTNEEIIQKEK